MAAISRYGFFAGQIQHLPHTTLRVYRMLAQRDGRFCTGPVLLQPQRHELLCMGLARSNISAALLLCELGKVKEQRH